MILFRFLAHQSRRLRGSFYDRQLSAEVFVVVCRMTSTLSNYISSETTKPFKSRKENPQKLAQLSPRSHPRHLVGKRTAQKDAIKDITSNSKVNSYFPYRWSPASLTMNIYFTYFYITRIKINNGTQHLKSLKSQNRRAALRRPAIKLLGGGGGGGRGAGWGGGLELVCGRPTFICGFLGLRD